MWQVVLEHIIQLVQSLNQKLDALKSRWRSRPTPSGEGFLHRVGTLVFTLRNRHPELAVPSMDVKDHLDRFKFAFPILSGWRLYVVGAVTAVIVLGSGLALAATIYWHTRPTVYYLDLGTGKLYLAPGGSPVPLKAPSGIRSPDGTPCGVHTYVYSCGDCANPRDRYIAFLETASQGDTQSSALAFSAPQPGTIPASHFVSYNGHRFGWHPADDAAGTAIIESASKPCPNGDTPAFCLPDSH